VKYGAACKGCPGQLKCKDEPSKTSPLEITCTACGGTGCGHCVFGMAQITCCPLKLITPEVMDLMQLADMFGLGLPPVAGGVLDQTAYFVSMAGFVLSETDGHKRRLQWPQIII
jgi:hypothetical protein